MKFPCDCKIASHKDCIEDALDYKSISKAVICHVEASRYDLIETLAESIATLLKNQFNLPWIKLRVSKPKALRHSRDVGVIIQR